MCGSCKQPQHTTCEHVAVSAVGAERGARGAQHLQGTQRCRDGWDAWGAQHLHGTQHRGDRGAGELPVSADNGTCAGPPV